MSTPTKSMKALDEEREQEHDPIDPWALADRYRQRVDILSRELAKARHERAQARRDCARLRRGLDNAYKVLQEVSTTSNGEAWMRTLAKAGRHDALKVLNWRPGDE